MTLIICLDLKNGISFNKRRQSRDSRVTERICEMAISTKLHINEYSKTLFPLPCSYINICEDSFENISEKEFCFCEREVSENELKNIDKIVVYCWNKVYPSDVSFNIKLKEWKLISSDKFKGSSHEEITEEVYIK